MLVEISFIKWYNIRRYSRSLNIWRCIMPILYLKMDNVLAFDNFEVSFSYPVKLRKTLIEEENLACRPTFRYKKVNIFIGSNATGKTSLMKCIWSILLFLRNKERNNIDEILNNNGRESTIVMDYAFEYDGEARLRRIIIKCIDGKLLMSSADLVIREWDSYESRVKDLDSFNYEFVDYIECINSIEFTHGWNVTLPGTEKGFDAVKILILDDKDEEKYYFDILNRVLKTLDPSIVDVRKSNDAPDAIVIEHENTGIIIIQSGIRLSEINYLSSGTKYGISLSNVIFSIKYHHNGIYLIDEQLSYVNSDIECSILSTIVSLIGPDEQVFFTTHNDNILELGFPFHSLYFMKKKYSNGKQKIAISCATEVENRNNVPVRSILDNDMLGSAPDVSRIYEIGE